MGKPQTLSENFGSDLQNNKTAKSDQCKGKTESFRKSAIERKMTNGMGGYCCLVVSSFCKPRMGWGGGKLSTKAYLYALIL